MHVSKRNALMPFLAAEFHCFIIFVIAALQIYLIGMFELDLGTLVNKITNAYSIPSIHVKILHYKTFPQFPFCVLYISTNLSHSASNSRIVISRTRQPCFINGGQNNGGKLRRENFKTTSRPLHKHFE
jgi:hypothetical protein